LHFTEDDEAGGVSEFGGAFGKAAGTPSPE
jgi:hypothetical protein